MSKIANHLRKFAIAVLIVLTGSAFAAREAPELQQLRDQLKKAQETEDKPAIIELSQRIIAIAPTDSRTWDTLAQTQLESEDLDDLERTLDAWQKAFKKPPAAIEDFRAGLCFKRKDYPCAEKHWLAFIATKPPRADAPLSSFRSSFFSRDDWRSCSPRPSAMRLSISIDSGFESLS